MYGLPPCFAMRSHIFRDRYALSAHSLPRLPMNFSSSSTCLESALNGDVTLKERINRLLQSTMKWSLRKSFLLFLLPCAMLSHLTYLQMEKPVLSMAQISRRFLLFSHSIPARGRSSASRDSSSSGGSSPSGGPSCREGP